MEAFFYLAIFIFGLSLGSFLGCVIYRLEKGESFLRGRSYCPHCKHILGWQDLIPVLSFLMLNGQCRYCKQKISWQYPFMELITGFLFLLVFYYFHVDLLKTIYYLIISSIFIIIFVYDLKYYIIPDRVVFPGIAISVLYWLLRLWHSGSWNLVYGLGFAMIPAIFLLAIILFSRGNWMGLGDFKLAILMGFFLGWPNILPALFSAFFLGAIIGLVLIILKKKGLKSEIPFGPFLIIGTFLALFWGNQVINWYLNFVFS